jgi:hypothetical protein
MGSTFLLDVEASILNHALLITGPCHWIERKQSNCDVYVAAFEFGAGRLVFDHLSSGFNALHLFPVWMIFHLCWAIVENALRIGATLGRTNL